MDGGVDPGSRREAALPGGASSSAGTVGVDVLLRPIASEEGSEAGPEGLDPRLAEEFEAIEFELAKIGGVELLEVDWPKVEGLAAGLLQSTGKDLRCAIYWAIARLHGAGIPGLRDGLALISGLLSQYKDAFFPRRPRGKASATEWFSEQLEVAIAGGNHQVTRDELLELEDMLGVAIEVFDSLDVDSSFFGSALDTLRQIKLVASEEEREEEVKRAFPEGYAEVGLTVLGGCPVTEASAETALSLRLRRWALWMATPAVLSGETRDVTTAQDAKDTLEGLASSNRWADLLVACEKALATSPFWLDLSVWAARAALHVVGEDGQRAIIGELRALLTRDPDLLTATDRDGTALAGGVAREWLEREVVTSGQSRGKSDSADVALPAEIEHMLEKGQTREAMIAAQQWVVQASGRVRFARSVALANAFKQMGAADQSFLVFRGLHNQLRGMTVKEWDPALFAECIAGFLRSKKAGMGLGPEDEPLLEELSVLDPTAVLGVLPA